MAAKARCPSCGNSVGVPESRPGSTLSCPRCGGRFTASARDTLPGKIGRFEVRSRLGAGAFGTVYRAYDPRLDREVALKVPKPGTLDSPKRVERFLREAKASAQLRHPHIVPVYDAGQDGEQYFIASAFIEGRTLEAACDGAPLDARRAAELVRGLAEALAYAHGQGIVHRDVKPANVMIDEAGDPHLMDFGLAARQDSLEKLTHDGAVLGTPAYMAPEQARGQRGDAEPAGDQYGLGVVLYEVLTGRVPFEGPPQIVLFHAVNTEPPAPRTLRPGIPRDLETVCLKAMAKRPQDRYANCQGLANDLRRWLEGEPVRARPLGPLERATRWCKRNPALAVTGTAAVVGLLAAALIAGGSAVRLAAAAGRERQARGLADQNAAAANQQRQRAEEAATDANQQRQRAEEEAARTRRHLYTAHINLAQRAWEAGETGRVQDLLSLDLPGAGGDDLRSFEWFYFWRLAHSERAALKGADGTSRGGINSVAFSPDGTLVAAGGVCGNAASLKLWDWAAGKQAVTLQHVGDYRQAVKGLAFSPDGKLVAAGTQDGTVRLWDVATGQPRASIPGHPEVEARANPNEVPAVAFSPDGKTLAWSNSYDMSVRLWDVAVGRERRLLSVTDRGGEHNSWPCPLAFAPDGKTLAVGYRNKFIKVWDVADGQARASLALEKEKDAGAVCALAFAPDGRTLAAGYDNGIVGLWDVATGQARTALPGHHFRVRALAFSPDGRTLASGGDDFKALFWDVATARQRAELPWPGNSFNGLAFSPDGRLLATAHSGASDNTVKLWDVKAALEAAATLEPSADGPHFSRIVALGFLADGQTVAAVTCGRPAFAGGHGSAVRLWEPTKGRQRVSFWAAGQVVSLAAGGKTLAVYTPDKSLQLLDTATGQAWAVLRGAPDVPTCAALTPDGKLLATGDEKAGRLWDVPAGTLRATLGKEGNRVNCVAFAPDGKTLATAGGQGVQLWDVATGAERVALKGNRTAFTCLAFSPDGKAVAAGGEDAAFWGKGGRVEVWDAMTAQVLASLTGHSRRVQALAFAPDGRTLATAAGDDWWAAAGYRVGELILWDPATGQQRLSLPGQPGPADVVAFAPDGRALAAGYEDGSVRVWRAATDQEASVPGEKSGR